MITVIISDKTTIKIELFRLSQSFVIHNVREVESSEGPENCKLQRDTNCQTCLSGAVVVLSSPEKGTINVDKTHHLNPSYRNCVHDEFSW